MFLTIQLYVKKDLPAVDADKLFNLPAGAVYAVYIWKILLYF
jgi:hypothetical protein